MAIMKGFIGCGYSTVLWCWNRKVIVTDVWGLNRKVIVTDVWGLNRKVIVNVAVDYYIRI